MFYLSNQSDFQILNPSTKFVLPDNSYFRRYSAYALTVLDAGRISRIFEDVQQCLIFPEGIKDALFAERS